MAPGRERAVEAEHERLPEEILERLHPADADRLVEADTTPHDQACTW